MNIGKLKIALQYNRNLFVFISDVRYEIFYILPITIIAHKIYHDMIIIMIYNFE